MGNQSGLGFLPEVSACVLGMIVSASSANMVYIETGVAGIYKIYSKGFSCDILIPCFIRYRLFILIHAAFLYTYAFAKLVFITLRMDAWNTTVSFIQLAIWSEFDCDTYHGNRLRS